MAIRALLFDFDGLLVDTEIAGFHAWATVFTEFGLTLEFDRWCDHVITHGGHEDFADFIDEAVGAQDWAVLHGRRRALRNTLAVAMPGAFDTIAAATRLGLRLAVVSNSPESWVSERMVSAGLSEASFDVLVTADNGLAPKPAPDGYVAALDLLGVGPDEAVVFEDAPRGVQAANVAGIYCVAVTNPVTQRGDFAGANERVDSMTLLRLADVVSAAEDFYAAACNPAGSWKRS